jgi:acetate kinase
MAVIGKPDAVVFTGGIGENSATVRGLVCRGLEHLGISLDEERNGAASGNVAEIQADGGPVKLLVVKTDEEREIARQTMRVIHGAGLKGSAGGPPDSGA